jgi:hypothetical protein
MTEREMEDLLWKYPERLLGEALTKIDRQRETDGGRPDLIFETRVGQFLVVEIKKGTVQREVIGQVYDYLLALKREFPTRAVELMVVANDIPLQRRVALEHLNIEWREIPVRRFRAVARELGCEFESEKALRGAGDIGDLGAVEVNYGDAPPDGIVPGKFLAVEEDQGDNQIVVKYYYDDDETESVTLFRDDKGMWRDYNYDVPVSINFKPSAANIEELRRRIGAKPS